MTQYDDTTAIVDNIVAAPFGTFTELAVRIFCRHYRHHELFNQLTLPWRTPHNERVIEQYVSRSFTQCEQWLTPWLVLNEERMNQIGLRKLDIKYWCSFSVFVSKDVFDDISGRFQVLTPQFVDS